MANDLVSIGLPVYNGERYLYYAVLSVLNQTYTNFELIVIDDGSCDSSVEIVRAFNDSRIDLYCDGKNKGLPSRLNEIASLAKGRFLARMDADDIMHPRRIEIQLKTLRNNDFIDVLGSNAYTIDESNVVKGLRQSINLSNETLMEVKNFIHPTIMAKREWFVRNEYRTDVLRGQDAELWFRTHATSKFYSLVDPLLFYREVAGEYYRKYFRIMRSSINVGRLYFRQKKYILAINWIFRRVLLVFFKAIIYYVFNTLGLESILIKRRNPLVSQEIIEQGQKLLNESDYV